MDLTTRMDRLIHRDILLHSTFLTGEELEKKLKSIALQINHSTSILTEATQLQ